MKHIALAMAVLSACGKPDAGVTITFGGQPCEGTIFGAQTMDDMVVFPNQKCGPMPSVAEEAVDETFDIVGLNELGELCYVAESVALVADGDALTLDVPALETPCATNATCPAHVDAMNPLYQFALELQRSSLAFCGGLFPIAATDLLLSNNVDTAPPSGDHTEAQAGLALEMSISLLNPGIFAAFHPPEWQTNLYTLGSKHVFFPFRFGAPSMLVGALEEPPPGDYFAFAMVLRGDIPEDDPANFYQYAFVFDADGNTSNNYTPLPQYPADFFKDTDRWYELLYTPTGGWTTKVSTAHGSTITPSQSNAQVWIAGSVVFLLVPASEFSTATPAYRFTAFRHKGDYGLQPPHDFDGYVDPPVSMGLHAFTR
jgi:hypothetical protein